MHPDEDMYQSLTKLTNLMELSLVYMYEPRGKSHVSALSGLSKLQHLSIRAGQNQYAPVTSRSHWTPTIEPLLTHLSALSSLRSLEYFEHGQNLSPALSFNGVQNLSSLTAFTYHHQRRTAAAAWEELLTVLATASQLVTIDLNNAEPVAVNALSRLTQLASLTTISLYELSASSDLSLLPGFENCVLSLEMHPTPRDICGMPAFEQLKLIGDGHLKWYFGNGDDDMLNLVQVRKAAAYLSPRLAHKALCVEWTAGFGQVVNDLLEALAPLRLALLELKGWLIDGPIPQLSLSKLERLDLHKCKLTLHGWIAVGKLPSLRTLHLVINPLHINPHLMLPNEEEMNAMAAVCTLPLSLVIWLHDITAPEFLKEYSHRLVTVDLK